MKVKLLGVIALTCFVVAAYAVGPTSKDHLIGKWKCVKEHDGAKIIGGYMVSIEFTPEELVLYYVGSPGTPFHCSYFVTKEHINATNLSTKEKWKFDYKFLENGDLYLHKEPWNWQGWFSKDFEKPRADDPGDPKNVSDYFSWLNRSL